MRIPALLLCVFSLLSATSAASETAGLAPETHAAINPENMGWSYLRLEARKFIFSASSEAQVEVVSSPAYSGNLIAAQQGNPVAPAEQMVRLTAVNKYFGKRTAMELLMNPGDARAVQYALDEDGKRLKHRIYRHTDTGIFVQTHRPAEQEDRGANWTEWSDISSDWRGMTTLAYGLPIVQPLGLLYVAGAADLQPGGTPLRLLSISDRKITTVELRAFAASPRRVNMELHGSSGSIRCRGRIPALRLEVNGWPLDPSIEATNFEFLGLEEDIRIYVQPSTGMILEVTGKAPIVGDIVIRAREARVIGEASCPVAS